MKNVLLITTALATLVAVGFMYFVARPPSAFS
jgi:hypothetical protein